MNATALSFPLEDTRIERSRRAVAHPVVEASEDSVTGVAGIALWDELLDRLGLVAEADRRRLRPVGPGGYTGGECYRAVLESQLAGGDFLADRACWRMRRPSACGAPTACRRTPRCGGSAQEPIWDGRPSRRR